MSLFNRHRGLIWSMVRREVWQRYRGSFLGPFWAIVTPAVQIVIFTLIFSGIFQARFGVESGPVGFAVHLFCGLLPWIAFSEAVQRSTTIVVENANLVKRVVFPIEALPVNVSLASVAHQALGTVVLLVAALVLNGGLTVAVFWWPILLVPQLLITIGLAWLVASLGVFLKDTGQSTQLLLMAWMYLTPIFYPESIVPPRYHWLVRWNPMAPLIRSYRRILLEGRQPDWTGLAATMGFAICCLLIGYWWFVRTRKAFADVL
ncbi:MAG: ABC transporter permease [Blastocatellia bacterium]|jgi:lipopolysaccharide transport system permease protein